MLLQNPRTVSKSTSQRTGEPNLYHKVGNAYKDLFHVISKEQTRLTSTKFIQKRLDEKNTCV